ncbi:MAG: hypothetical protein KDA69_10025 [Planctomycetaceae bacterium]|nr:hypothetical protein [Planctomycetaceae bacterium]
MKYEFVGLDEAGLGPNLGPLVCTATSWELPADAASFDFYAALAPTVLQSGKAKDVGLHIADSKDVFSGKGAFGRLERAAVALLRNAGCQAATLLDLITWLTVDNAGEKSTAGELWLESDNIAVPFELDASDVDSWARRLEAAIKLANMGSLHISSSVLFPRRFNKRIDETGNKSLLLSTTMFETLKRVWSPKSDFASFVVSDKHGGRNRYGDLLTVAYGGQPIETLEEGPELSRYTLVGNEVRFQVGGEAHLPVAAASIVSKYVRELSMEAFNRFWKRHLPDIKPTKGYPNDAKRFRDETAETRKCLGIADADFWRAR